jgi:putative nucleotide binding protein
LTGAAKAELPGVIARIALNREDWFVNFFNTARAVTPRMHALELIPGIGKKYMWQVINERDRKPFESYEDLQKRTELPNPVKLITKRVLEELEGDSKYRLFTRAQ